MTRLLAIAFCFSSLFAATASRAVAAPQEEPWAVGVSADNRNKANALFAEGNDRFAEKNHVEALRKFKEAIALWDHPGIWFNTAMTLIQLDRFLEAADALDAALRYGSAPFSAEQYGRVLDYQKLVNRGIGELEVSCTQQGVTVQVDGQPLLSCPGTIKRRIAPGEHVVVGERADLVPESHRIAVTGGATKKVDVFLRTLEESVALEYPTPRWIPWVVTGAGATLAGIGIGLVVSARSDRSDLDTEIEDQCGQGCTPQQMRAFDTRIDDAQSKNTIGIVTLVTGGLAVAGGVTWTILNRPRNTAPVIEATPTSGGATASLRWTF